MPGIRVLVVDDSVAVRKILTDVIDSDPDLEVAGIAANGKIALQKIEQVNPDVISLDMEMPEMDGMETILRIREKYPKLPVVVFSALTEKASKRTLEALSLGANDYVTKPAGENLRESESHLREELLPKLKALCKGKQIPTTSDGKRTVSDGKHYEPLLRRIDAVLIGVSTGGPNALSDIFQNLPGDFPVPILIVQHMPPVFTKSLAERLTSEAKMPVLEATAGMVVEPSKAYLAPGDFHMTLSREEEKKVVIRLNKDMPENSCRPAVDVLFRSAVRVYKSNLLALILTGMGQDGLRGVQFVKEAGGLVFAQDQASSVVWGMPGAVVTEGLADKVLPLSQVAMSVVSTVQKYR